ncbi:MAG: hypothetical protein K9M80_00950 [Candidatus Marinimicrobia bacterium]|nr:hypothetical protein [Candidatus Neomarinimicrobiota bacterium]
MDRKIIIYTLFPLLLFGNELGDMFAKNGYYFEAITEYKRELSLNNNVNRDSLLFKISQLYYQSEKREQAEKYALKIVFNNQESKLETKSLILLAKIHWDKYDYTAFRNTLDFINTRTDSVYICDIHYIKAWSYYYDADWKKGNQIVKSLNLEYKNSLLKDIQAVQSVPQKSKQFAVVASSIIPGSGQLYAGDYENAAFSFLLVGSIGGSIIWNVIQHAYGIALVKYIFLFNRYYKGGLHNLANKIEKDNINRIGNYLKKIGKRYPDPIEKLEKISKGAN